MDDGQEVISAGQGAEVAELLEGIDWYCQRGSCKKDVEDRHKREVRRHRTAELRFALATFAGVYRDALPTARHPQRVLDGLRRIDAPALALERSPHTTLLLQAPLPHLPPLVSSPASDALAPSVPLSAPPPAP